MRLAGKFTRNLKGNFNYSTNDTADFLLGFGEKPLTVSAGEQLLRDAQAYRSGWMGKLGTGASVLMGLGSIPMIAGMFVPDANTRALEKMRNEDKLREAKGMRPLTQTGQLLKDKMSQATNAIQGKQAPVANTVDAVRTINPAPNFILPKALPPGSMAGGAMNLF